jgi:hypothetical protein
MELCYDALTIGRDDCSTSANTLNAVDKHDPLRSEGMIYEPTRTRKVYQEIGIIDILNRNAHMGDTRFGHLGGYMIGANRQDVRYAAFAQGS